MKWIDFQCIATENGLDDDAEIDSIEKIGDRYDICYTDTNGYAGVIEIREED